MHKYPEQSAHSVPFRLGIRVQLWRWLFLPLSILSITSCQPGGKNISEPVFHPHVLTPGPYTPAQGRIVDSDSVKKPVYVSYPGKYIPESPPRFTPLRSQYHRTDKPRYLPGNGQVVNMDSLVPPPYVPAEGKRVPSSWPQWQPAKPVHSGDTRFHFAYLDAENGLGADIVTCLLEARDGRIWAGTWSGGISVWDGAGILHFTTANGLSLDMAECLMQANDGKIWIGTSGGGVSVWDGTGFTHFTEAEGLAGNDVRGIVQGQDGRIWIGTWGGGISVWDGTGFTQYRKENGLADNYITSLMESRDGRIWIGTWYEGLSVWDGTGFTHFAYDEFRSGLSTNTIYSLMESQDGKIWIGTWGGGINVWDGTGFTQYGLEEGLSHDVIRTMTEGPDGKIWIGTQGKGVNVWDGQGFFHYTEDEGLHNSVISSSIRDSGGNILLGTWGGGIHIWHAEGFTHFSNKDSWGNNDIRSIMEDRKGRLWIGTNGEGISILDDSSFAHHFTPGNQSGNVVTALLESRDGRTWIGAWGEGINIWDGAGFTQYKKDAGLTANNISSFIESRDGKIWIGTWGGGVNVWDQGRIAFFTTSEGLIDNTIYSLLETRDGRVWIGTAKGLSVWDGTTFTNFSADEGLKGEFVWSLLEDREGHVWIGTNHGIHVWDGAGFTHYTTREGLRDNHVSHLCLDKQDQIWVGTHKGLHKLSPKQENGTRELQVFINTDGLGGTSIGRMLVDRKEHLWLYTTRGLDKIALPLLRANTSRPVLAIRELQPFFTHSDWRKVKEGEEDRMKEQPFSLKGVRFDSVYRYTNLPANPVFPHDINQLSLSWQAIQWEAPHQLQYSYLLEGQDRFWSPLVSEDKVTFPDLNPGSYTFKVRAVGGNNQWSETVTYAFTIRQPWWWTHLAKIFYLALGIIAIAGIYRYQLGKTLVEQEARQLRELDEMKSRFFTNISHEFRTPLTIIGGMADQVLQELHTRHPAVGEKVVQHMKMIQRNNGSLLYLVNQILDLRKLEAGKLSLHLIQGDIVAYLRYILESFHSLAKEKDLSLHFLSEPEEIYMAYDPEKMMRIIYNLLSNAIKFTEKGGAITLRVERFREDRIRIGLQDTGIGIPEEMLPHIFDQFYQVDVSMTRKGEGSGIGLAIVHKYVELMDGAVKVESEPGRGTLFVVQLPIHHQARERREADFPQIPDMKRYAHDALPDLRQRTDSDDLPHLLIVEDNPDIVRYIHSFLKDRYQISIAQNGQEGIDQALEEVPDIIISDLMMPEKDGYALTQTLKSDQRTSHIPIILLTAKADEDSRLRGLERGADVYLVKPFSQRELEIHLDKLLRLRETLRARYSGDNIAQLRPSEDPGVRQEDAFITELRKAVEENLDVSPFGVPELCTYMGMSKSQLHRKITALTGRSTSIFMRFIRLEKSKELMRNTRSNISEIAYEVGFSDVAYFSRCFSGEYGISPSTFVDQLHAQQKAGPPPAGDDPIQ